MTDLAYAILFMVIMICTPFCGAQMCDPIEGYIQCVNITEEFPYNMYFNDYNRVQCTGCKLENFSSSTFPFENQLEYFDISSSGLKFIDSGAFKYLTSLIYLYLNDNEIKNISKQAFQGLGSLEELHLEQNLLESINPGFLEGTSCNFINLSHNAITELAPDVFYGVSTLVDLDLSYNNLTKLYKDTFQGVEKLRILDLSYNKLGYIPLGMFRSLENLNKLNLSNNMIQRFQLGALSGLENLHFLNLASNSLKSFNASILLSISNLISLDISGNGIYDLDVGDVYLNVPSLKFIYLEDNIFTCTNLKSILQLLKDKRINVLKNIKRFDYENVNAIACVEIWIVFFKSLSLATFLSTSKSHADELEGYLLKVY